MKNRRMGVILQRNSIYLFYGNNFFKKEFFILYSLFKLNFWHILIFTNKLVNNLFHFLICCCFSHFIISMQTFFTRMFIKKGVDILPLCRILKFHTFVIFFYLIYVFLRFFAFNKSCKFAYNKSKFHSFNFVMLIF